MYAAGKIPGSFFKREGRAGEKGTLTARMIDRPIRPLFPKGWHFETQLVAMPLSVDHVNPYDILAMNGASAALMISPVPLPTPVGAVRIGKIDGNFVVNPPEESLSPSENESTLDLIVAGTDEAILMVEAGATEISEAEILDALDIAHDEIKKLCALQRDLAAKVGKEKIVVEAPVIDEDLLDAIKASHGADLDAATQVEDKLDRQDATEGRQGGDRRAVRRRSRGRGLRRQARRRRWPRSRRSRRRRSATGSPSRRSAPTGARPRRSARSRSRSASRRARTARRSSRAARRRRSRSPRSAR